MNNPMEFPMFNLPPIRPSSNKQLLTDRHYLDKSDTNSYDEWRANIHQQLEDNICRQVQQVIEESERQERLAKLRRQYMRVEQRHNAENELSARPCDPWSEIDRRNQLVLDPFQSRNSNHPTRFQSSNNFRGKVANQNFNVEPLPNYSNRRNSLTNPENSLNDLSNLEKVNQNQTDGNYSFIYGNSIIKSNKANFLTIFGNNSGIQSYVNKQGVVITEDGPFWPRDYRILHPTPRLLTRELTPKEFYLNATENASQSRNGTRQTYDNQPALQKFTDPFKHPVVVYDMEKSARQQQPKSGESEQICPSLIFESRFEGGNLRQAKRVGQFEYELVLRPDLYTRRHTQWYYFRVQNMVANTTYRFRIINLVKRSSLYKEGMQILVFSEIDARKDLRGWYRAGHHINYSESQQKSYNSLLERDINYYELDFQLEFNHSGDTCYIAHCYPYTFTDLKEDLDRLATIRSKEIFQREVLCESQAGNSCFLITVTDQTVPIEKKKFVFITARIHPGETNSSFMMRGLLEYITSEDRIARQLRSQLIFKIVPMLNPDGVIIGNYRCSLTGKDMNRNFRHPRKQTFPTIFHVKELMQSLKRENHEILAFCDLHGHSRKSNVFAYGCDGCDGPQPDMKNFLNARVLPYIMSRTAPDMFAFDFCKFHIHRCKESTGRVVMWKEMAIQNSFTLEASFAGSSIVEKPCHFSIQDYEKFGQHICQSLKQYLNVLSDTARLDSIFMDITKNVLRKLGKEALPITTMLTLSQEGKQDDQTSLSITSVSSCLQVLTQCHAKINEQEAVNSSSDSDSDPEGGEIPDFRYNKESRAIKKKNKKNRSEKTNEERSEKLNRKREISRAHFIKPVVSTTSEDTNISLQRRARVSYPMTTENEINIPVKLVNNGNLPGAPVVVGNNPCGVAVSNEQMEKSLRGLAPRSQLFISKYANRSGHGLPIFTTERAMERRKRRVGPLFPDIGLDRASHDDEDSDDEAENIPLRERVHEDQSSQNDKESSAPTTQLTNVKKTASLISLTLKDLPNVFNENSISTISGTVSTASSMFKTSTQRRLQRLSKRNQPSQAVDKSSNKSEKEQKSNGVSNLSTVSNLVEVALHTPTVQNVIPLVDNDNAGRYTFDTQVDTYGINHHRLYTIPDTVYRALSRNESPLIRTNSTTAGVHVPIIGGGRENLMSRSASFVVPTPTVQQTLPSIDAILRERSIIIANESLPPINPMDRVHQALRQLYVPNDKR